jgi:hypothetical protein
MEFPTKSVTFVQDQRYDGGGVEHERREFKRGETYELPEPSALHWVQRGKAVIAADAAPSSPAPPALVVKPAPAAGNKAIKAHQVRTKGRARAAVVSAPASTEAPAVPGAGE